MHGKERAIAPALQKRLGARTVVPASLDTDALGTFTGEIARVGTMGETAIASAAWHVSRGREARQRERRSVRTPPHVPFVPCGRELVVFVDDENGFVVSDSCLSLTTNFISRTSIAHPRAESLAAYSGLSESCGIVSRTDPSAFGPEGS